MRILIIGGGSIGQRHIANLLELKAGDLELCDSNPARVEELHKRFGIRGTARLEEALDRRPEAVLICTPTSLHVPIALKAVQTGAALLIEKPVSDSLEETEKLAALARQHRATILVGCNMRFHPGVASLKTAAAGLLKKPLLIRAWFSHYLPNWRPTVDYRQTYSARHAQGGGIIFECVHELDYLRWMFGEVAHLDCFADRISDLEIDSEDIALIRLNFENGTVGQLHLDYLSPLKMRGCEVIGVDGIVRWSSEGKSPEKVLVQHFDNRKRIWHDLVRLESYDANQMYLQELQHFLDCIGGTATPMVDLETGLRTVQLALAAKEKAAHQARPLTKELA